MTIMDGAVSVEQLGPSALAHRAELTCATFDLCAMYLDLHRRCWDADARGAPLDVHGRAQLVDQLYHDEVLAFATAWQRGPSFEENQQVAEIAACSFAALFNDETIKQGVERWMLDFVRDYGSKVSRRLVEAAKAKSERSLSDPHLDGLTSALAALLRAVKLDGATPDTPEVSCTMKAVKAALGDAMSRGYDKVCLQAALDFWTEANDGPRIVIETPSPPGMNLVSPSVADN